MLLRALAVSLCAVLIAGCVAVEQRLPESSTVKRIALTFDDIPRGPGVFMSEDERTARLIAALDEAGVEQAAFFLNPGKIVERPGAEARIDAYVTAGHVIANHTDTHPQLSDTETEVYLADIDAAQAWLVRRPGNRLWFRYPYLDEGRGDAAKRDAIREGLAERGLQNGYVTVDASDWFYDQLSREAVEAGAAIDMEALGDLFVESHVQSAEFSDGLARRALGRSPAHVMLLHETDLAALWVDDLVTALEAEGWTIVTADEAFADPVAIEATRYDTPSAQGTLIEMIAWQRGIPAPRWYARNNTNLARAEFDRRVLGIERPQQEIIQE